jgi:hypothetical protein
METCQANRRVDARARLRRILIRELPMLRTHLSPILSIIAGIAILVVPRLLNYIVAIYLIVIGIIGLGILRI